jgi:hypothetical protein
VTRQGLPLVPKKASSSIYFSLETREWIVATQTSFFFDANCSILLLNKVDYPQEKHNPEELVEY